MGRDLLARGEYTKAITLFKKALTVMPESLQYHYFLSVAYAMVDSVRPAMKEYKVLFTLGDTVSTADIKLKEKIAEFLNVDPYPPQRLTRNKSSEFAPRFAPDGKSILMVSDRTSNGQIYLMDLSGKIIKRFAKSSRWDTDPAMSAKGNELVFSSDRDGDKEIYLLDIKGGKVAKLTNNAFEDRDPSFSPDGQKNSFRF